MALNCPSDFFNCVFRINVCGGLFYLCPLKDYVYLM